MLPNQRGTGNCKTCSVQSSFISLIFPICFRPAYLSLTGPLWPCASLLIQCRGSAALPDLELVKILPLTFFLLQGNHFNPWCFKRQKFVIVITLCIKAATWRVTPYSMQAFPAGPCLMLTVEREMLFPSTFIISPSKRYKSEKCPGKKLVFLLCTERLNRSTSLTTSCRSCRWRPASLVAQLDRPCIFCPQPPA